MSKNGVGLIHNEGKMAYLNQKNPHLSGLMLSMHALNTINP